MDYVYWIIDYNDTRVFANVVIAVVVFATVTLFTSVEASASVVNFSDKLVV